MGSEGLRAGGVEQRQEKGRKEEMRRGGEERRDSENFGKSDFESSGRGGVELGGAANPLFLEKCQKNELL